MRTIAHISDIHFGRADYTLLDPLVETVTRLNPDLVIVSGDFTQRALTEEFQEAQAFLHRLPSPQLTVPGNHDVPLYNVFKRFLTPLRKYRKYISPDLEPFFCDNEIAVAGFNTARSLTRKNGRINQRQIDAAVARFEAVNGGQVKIVVSHHPFDLPIGGNERDLVGRAELGMKALAACGADLFLSGHLHLSRTGSTSERYKIDGHSALFVHAGTGISTRGRGEANAFNVIRVQRPEITVQKYEWAAERSAYEGCEPERFTHRESGWSRAASA